MCDREKVMTPQKLQGCVCSPPSRPTHTSQNFVPFCAKNPYPPLLDKGVCYVPMGIVNNKKTKVKEGVCSQSCTASPVPSKIPEEKKSCQKGVFCEYKRSKMFKLYKMFQKRICGIKCTLQRSSDIQPKGGSDVHARDRNSSGSEHARDRERSSWGHLRSLSW